MVRKTNPKSVLNIIRVLVFAAGFCICIYPLVSSFAERQRLLKAVATYEKDMEYTDDTVVKNTMESAVQYNDMLYQNSGRTIGEFDGEILGEASYNQMLNLSGNGIMGSVEIPKINVHLPIYHGTSEEVLSAGVGHLRSSSLPVGGINTRTVLTGHRGLPDSKLFTRLDELEKEDLFFIKVLGEKLAYKVTEIEVIEPDDVKKLEIMEGKDMATLLTCTPYGINTHRLIVTGVRVPYKEDEYRKIEEKMMSFREVIFAGIPFMFAGFMVITVVKSKRRRKNDKAEKVWGDGVCHFNSNNIISRNDMGNELPGNSKK